jgi:hypothetical protein
MQKLFKTTFFVILTLSFLSGCSKKQEQVPTQEPVVAGAAPTQPAPTQAQAPAVAPSFDGEWSGNSGENLPISFSIGDNQVTSLSASYSGRNGTCSFNGMLSTDGPSPITDKTFTALGRSTREVLEFTAKGTLTSPTDASGTLVWKGKSEVCGDINLNYQWAAKKAATESLD